MGRIRYAKDTVLELDDHTVSHLQAVIETKLRRGEPFTLGWTIDPSQGGGRVAVWLSRASHVTFGYRGERPTVDRDRFDAMMDAANSTRGVTVTPAPVRA